MYRCVAVSVEGFVQQLAVSYIAQGYRFYVACHIPPGKDLAAVDAKIVERYGLDLSKWARARRKRQGRASVQYLRYGRFFVLIATVGEHLFFEREAGRRDIRESPIRFAGYSIGSRPGHDGVLHASVRLHDDCLRRVRRRVHAVALHPSVERLAALFHGLRFVPYAPVRRQLLKLLWQVNGRRKVAGLEPVPVTALRLRRWPVRPFGGARQDVARSVGEARSCTPSRTVRRQPVEGDEQLQCRDSSGSPVAVLVQEAETDIRAGVLDG